MSEPMDCADVRERDLIALYVSDRLDQVEAEAFEEHYLTCERCREDVAVALAVQEEFRRQAVVGETEDGEGEDGESSRRRWAVPLAGLGGLAAAAAALLLFLPIEGGDSELARLGAVSQPPVYLGVPVRSTEGSADSLFARGMREYSTGDFARARSLLQQSLQAGVDEAPARFFLGATLLMLDRPEEAARALDRVTRLGETPYLTEALFYRSKALLRMGDAGGALEALERAAAREGTVAEQAAALADSVGGAPRD